MTDTYVVVAQVAGFTKENRAEKLDYLSHLERPVVEVDADGTEHRKGVKIKLVDSLIRDDGSAELCFDWQPAEEPDGTRTWFEARDSVEHIRSSIQGAALAVLNPITVELRDVKASGPAKPKARKQPSAAAKPEAAAMDSAARPSAANVAGSRRATESKYSSESE